MLSKHSKAAKRTITFLVIGLVFAMFASSASAECGPAFTKKAQAVNYYKNNPGAAKSLKKWLLKHPGAYQFNADQGLIQYLQQSNVRVFNTPRGYVLNKNTYCPNGPEGGYGKYRGLYDNMGGKPMLWYCNKAGKCFPILKGYCRNAVMGPPVMKKPPKKHTPPKKCKCKKKPKCKKKCKKPPKPITCEAQGMITVAGNCVNQSNTAEQDCQATVGGQWNGSQCVIVQINANCSNVVVGENSNVNQGGNCNTVVTPPPPPPPPCTTNCHPEPPPPTPPTVEWERIQEVYTDHERKLCVTVTPATGVSVQFGVKWGERSNGGKGVYNASTNKYCVQYTAPSEEPPHTCVEPISDKLPPGTKCDIANVAVTSSNGAKQVTGTMEIPILEEDKVVVW